MNSFLQLIDPKIVKILRQLVNSPEELFHIQKLSHQANLPLSSTFRIINRLVKLKIVTIVKVGNFKIYKFNKTQINEARKWLGEK